MAIQRFEDSIAWQKAQEIAVQIYAAFKNCKDYSFKDQITRAAVSISNNIAEGFDRSSHADFARFLYIALGSCNEVKSMVYLSLRLEYLSIESHNELLEKSNEISKIIRGLIKSLK